MPILETIEIAAPVERVWDVTLDLDRWPDWTPTVTAVEVLGPTPLDVGSSARLSQPGSRPAVWTVTALRAPEEFAWETRALGTRVLAVHRLESLAPDRTRVTLEIHVTGPTAFLLRPLVHRISRRLLPQEAAGLKAACERRETFN